MRSLHFADLKDFLDEKAALYNRREFIESDPISIPHRFSVKQDVEIAGFLTALISWGQRPVILKNATALLNRMDRDPFAFILDFTKKDLAPFSDFVHRTFNNVDCVFFLKALQEVYRKHNSLEPLFITGIDTSQDNLMTALVRLRNFFFDYPHADRTRKHFANPLEGSAAKRLNMFLRWMIRNDKSGVDFGIWKIDPALLTCPLDVHSGRVARKLKLLNRNQNDWQAASELTQALKKFDSADPVKYDFALFGLGVFEKF